MWQADYGDGSAVWDAMELIALAIFTVELALNIYSQRSIFWDDQLNWIDAAIVAISLIDCILTYSIGGTILLAALMCVRIH